jgi:hypothetical protein
MTATEFDDPNARDDEDEDVEQELHEFDDDDDPEDDLYVPLGYALRGLTRIASTSSPCAITHSFRSLQFLQRARCFKNAAIATAVRLTFHRAQVLREITERRSGEGARLMRTFRSKCSALTA